MKVISLGANGPAEVELPLALPFVDAAGDRQDIAISSGSTLPFFASDGTQNNIAMSLT